ncbi:MAG: Ig-like domain-containing protein [Burkholderiales bacterium]|nr:Ig-like domain-containing protein [Burkholderiales bacterium]
MTTMLRKLFSVLALSGLAALAACGAGGGDTGTTPFGNGNTGGGGTPTPTASDLIVDASGTQLSNTASSTINFTITAVDVSRVVVAGATVLVAADNEGVVTQSASSTDSTGKITASLGIGGNRANRLITVTVTSGSVVKTATVQVTGTQINGTLVPAVVAPSTAAAVQYRVVDQAGNPMAGQAVSVSAPGMSPTSATGTTGANGDYNFNYTASATAGTFSIATTIAGVTDTQTVSVQSSGTVGPVTVAIASASVSANPSVVGVNGAGSTANRSEIRALFLTAGNAPIKDVRVRFDLANDPNLIGGTFSTGNTTLYSDANGIVTTAYIPGTRSSPTDGVTVRACYGNTDSDPNLLNCATSALVRLTVVSEPLGVSIGTNAEIVVGELTFTKRFLVSVADSAGNAKSDVPLSVSLDLPRYRKGEYAVIAEKWDKVGGIDTAVCLNEDSNRNGVLETGEDLSGNVRLDPGRSDVTVRLIDPRTRADGSAIVEITYAKSFATWVDAWITVAASGVSGTEGRATYVLEPVPRDAASRGAKDVEPAYRISPYGRLAGCNNSN